MGNELQRQTKRLLSNSKARLVAFCSAALLVAAAVYAFLIGVANMQGLIQAAQTVWGLLATPWFALILIAVLALVLRSGLKEIAEAEKLGNIADQKARQAETAAREKMLVAFRKQYGVLESVPKLAALTSEVGLLRERSSQLKTILKDANQTLSRLPAKQDRLSAQTHFAGYIQAMDRLTRDPPGVFLDGKPKAPSDEIPIEICEARRPEEEDCGDYDFVPDRAKDYIQSLKDYTALVERWKNEKLDDHLGRKERELETILRRMITDG